MNHGHRFLLVLLLALSGNLAAQSAPKDFTAFFSKFKGAVAQQDQTTLTGLMASPFAFIRAQDVPPAQVFAGLAADHGLQWQNLQQAVQGQPGSYHSDSFPDPARVLQCTPTEPIYSCLVVFTQDAQRHWRWKAMIMPTR
jgi:hypothetical protein